MRQKNKTRSIPTSDGLNTWRISLWLVVFGGLLFFWPTCLDRYLAPRFFFLSGALIVSIWLLWKDLRKATLVRWHIFDLLLLGWYGLNLASLGWTLSWSEGIFYAQKAWLLFVTYWLLRQALLQQEELLRKTLGHITLAVTGIVSVVLLVQLLLALAQKGLDNETLYDYASGLFGNKSLAAEFLFLLLIFNGLFVAPMLLPARQKWMSGLILGTLLMLILVLQVRTALVATVLGAGLYCLIRAFLEAPFRKIVFQKILPAVLLLLGLAAGLLSWKGQGNSMAERLNPLHYLESATANERRFVWYRTDQLNAEHYWLGVGDGSWKFWMPSKNIGGGYRLAEKNVVFTRAHNDYLEIRAEMGIIGAVYFCGLFGLPFLMAGWTLRSKDSLLAASGLAGYGIIQYFDFPRERIEFQVALAVLFALLAHGTRSIGWMGGTFTQKRSPIFLGLLLTGLAFNLVIGWERMSGEIHNIRMMDAQAQGNWRQVVAESTLAENPFYEYTDASMPLAWHEGTAWFQLSQFEKSAVAYARAYRLNPWSFQVINNYASALVKLKRYTEAIPLFETALAINPRYDEGKFNLSFVYYQLADYPRSAAWLNRVDTIAGPANDADREKNRTTLKRLKEFRKVMEEKHR